MEEQLSQNTQTVEKEPAEKADNSELSSNVTQKESQDNSQEPESLILGKFKSAEDLTKAYQQLEKLQGNQSSELGMLREQVASMNTNNEMLKLLESVYQSQSLIQDAAKKYPDYFADPSFKQIYTDAFKAIGADLDIDKLVSLVESYASARIYAHEKSKAASAETQQAIGGMKFDKNDKNISTPVKKSIQQMTPKELDELLDRLI